MVFGQLESDMEAEEIVSSNRGEPRLQSKRRRIALEAWETREYLALRTGRLMSLRQSAKIDRLDRFHHDRSQ